MAFHSHDLFCRLDDGRSSIAASPNKDTTMWISPKRRRASTRARLPDGIRIYAGGDVHGRSDLLDRVFCQIDRDLEKHPTPRAIEVFLGDYIDRGPDSLGVLDRLLERRQVREVACLKGNHEP